MKKRLLSCVLSLGLCVSLIGCHSNSSSGPQEKDAAEAMTNFLTMLQSGDTKAVSYLKDGNELNQVFAALDGDHIPEMDEVYRQFFKQVDTMTFQVNLEDDRYDMVTVTAQAKDFGSAIRSSMSQAIQTQVAEGGDAFSTPSNWLLNGLNTAEMGEQDEFHVSITNNGSSSYLLGHQSNPEIDFLNGVTGGFYDFADLSMTVCTSPEGAEVAATYYIAAIGDEVIGYVMTMEEPFDTTQIDSAQLALLQQEVSASFDQLNGVSGHVSTGDGTLITTVGIDFYTADGSALEQAGVVSGNYDHHTSGHLSLAKTLSGFEKDGMTCVTTPQYEKE